jgi:hypothetical protein
LGDFSQTQLVTLLTRYICLLSIDPARQFKILPILKCHKSLNAKKLVNPAIDAATFGKICICVEFVECLFAARETVSDVRYD